MDNFMERYRYVFGIGFKNRYMIKYQNETVWDLQREFFAGISKSFWKANLIQVYLYAIIHNTEHQVAFRAKNKTQVWNAVQSFVLLAQDVRIDLKTEEAEEVVIWVGETKQNRNIFKQTDQEITYFLFNQNSRPEDILDRFEECFLYADQTLRVGVTSYIGQRFVKISTTMDCFQIQTELVKVILSSQVTRVTISYLNGDKKETYIFVRQ